MTKGSYNLVSSVSTTSSTTTGTSSAYAALLDWLPSDYDKLVYVMRKAGLIRDHRLPGSGRILRNAFKGDDFVSWLIKERHARRSEALEVGQEVVERFFSRQSIGSKRIVGEGLRVVKEVVFNSEEYYQLGADEDPLQPLNAPVLPMMGSGRGVGGKCEWGGFLKL